MRRLLLIGLVLLAGCSSQPAFVGSWTGVGNPDGKFYGKQIGFSPDGFSVIDGKPGTWKLADSETLMLTTGEESAVVPFSVDGDILILKLPALEARFSRLGNEPRR